MNDDPLERALHRKLDRGEKLQDFELEHWYRFHPEDQPSKPVHDADLIPDVSTTPRQDDELQTYLDRIDIFDAYRAWGGKGFTPKAGSKRESIMIRCPDPAHTDEETSAWINADKQVYFCNPCDRGGDKYHIAAFKFGYNVPGYQHDGSFPKLRIQMVEDLFGVVPKRGPSGALEITPLPEPEPERPNLTVVPIRPEEDEDDDLDDSDPEYRCFLDWESLVEPNTFLAEWMDAVTQNSSIPPEFFFWLGLCGIALAAGDDVVLLDYKVVTCAIYICLFGKTSSGKTRALEILRKLIQQALPYEPDKFNPTKGVKILPPPGSAEALIKQFIRPLYDPSSPDEILGYDSVRGFLELPEFSSFVRKAAGTSGNHTREAAMNLYDCYKANVIATSTVARGVEEAHSPYCVTVTTTQPKAVNDFVQRTDMHSGFLNRFIFVGGESRNDPISYGGTPPNIDGPIEMLRLIHEWAQAGHTMELTGDAFKAWDSFFKTAIEPMNRKTDESMFGRIELHLKKLIILFAINDKAPQPTVIHVKRACSVFQYLITTYSVFAQEVSVDEVGECRKFITNWIPKWMSKTDGIAPTRRDVVQHARRYRTEVIDRTLSFLEKNDIITVRVDNSGQRAKRIYLA